MAVRVERLGTGTVQSWAPGRVTFVGDHTDYNFGLSLATALPQGTSVRISSQPDRDEFISLDGQGPAGWERYAAACLQLVRESAIEIPPLRFEVWGDLPIGAGLSSSASLISATLAGIYGLASVHRSADLLAADAQRVENVYLGVPTGTLDQEVIVRSRQDQIVLVDFGRDTVRAITRPHIDGHQLLVVDTGIPRRLDLANYGNRRSECTIAITQLLGAHDRESWMRFRSLDWPEIHRLAERGGLTRTSVRRLAHVWSENRRVAAMPDALASGDAPRISMLINQSHESLRDDFEVSTPEVEHARDAVLAHPGVRAARIVGAGFGGCLLALAADTVEITEYPSFPLPDPLRHRQVESVQE